MLDWLRRRNASPPPAEAHAVEAAADEAPRLMADGKPSRYVTKDDPDLFAGDPLPLRLVPYGAGNLTFVEDSTGLLVGPTDRRLARVGIHVVKLRGESYHGEACRSGDFAPGAPVRLVPEPDNAHDPNAVAVTEDRDGAPVAAYVSKGHAKRIGRLVASGDPLRVVAMRGTGPGTPCGGITVLAGHPGHVEHLLSSRPEHLPPAQTE